MNSRPIPASRAIDDPLLILIPVFNDWESLGLLLPRLDAALADAGLRGSVLLIDDGSTAPFPAAEADFCPVAIRNIEVLSLRRNLGHQRALAIGLAFVADRGRGEWLVVMDGDGEDDPRDVPRLIEKGRQEECRKVVLAERNQRSEAIPFRASYALFKLLHLVLTGYPVRFGNFSAIPRRRLESLAVVSELWNHYPSAVHRSRQPHCTIPTRRGRRLAGRSHMTFVALVIHGLSAISVYAEIVGVRLLVAALAGVFGCLVGIGAIVYIRLSTDWAIPGWATYGVGMLLILLTQIVMLICVFVFIVLSGRNAPSFLPNRDYGYFLGELRRVFGDP